MAHPPRALQWYVTAVITVGLCVIAHALYELPQAPEPLGALAFALLALGAAAFPIKIPGVPVYFSISDTFFITSGLLFGPAPATLTIAVDSFIISLRRRNDTRQLLFNFTSAALALWCGMQAYYALSPHGPLWDDDTRVQTVSLLPLACFAGVYFLVNAGLMAVVVSLSKRIPAIELWRRHFAVISLNYFAAASAAFFLIILMQHVGITALIAVMPLIAICHLAMRSWLGRLDDAQRHLQKINQMYMSTIGAFATAIEAKDGVTGDHVHRVQAYALGLARALGIEDEPTLKAIEAAALLHDTGKLAVPEHILNKPGRLTPDEYETMKAHVDVGADILASIDFPYPVVPIVRAHHEHWDGTGYPRGLRGEEIPIGARILSVVDCFDAVTSDRPYRRAMSEEEAVAIILERRGTVYDPKVVDAFVRVYRDILPAEPPQALQDALRRIRRTHAESAAATPARPAPADVSNDASEELLAFVSLARVMTVPPSTRDVGLLAWGHLRQLAPSATLAVFAPGPARGALAVRYAAGPGAAAVSGLAIQVGYGISGWVAATRRSMVNADARLDLGDETVGELRTALSLPLVAGGQLAGVMTLYAPEPFTEVQTRRLEMIAPHLAMAFAAVDEPHGNAASARSDKSSRDLRVVARR